MTYRTINNPYFILTTFDDEVLVKYAETYNIVTGKYNYFNINKEIEYGNCHSNDNMFINIPKN